MKSWPNTKSQTSGDRIARDAFLILSCAFAFLIFLNIYSFLSMLRTNRLSSAVKDATHGIKERISAAGTRFREICAGGCQEDVKPVLETLHLTEGEISALSALGASGEVPARLASYRNSMADLHLAIAEANEGIGDARTAYEASHKAFCESLAAADKTLETAVAGRQGTARILFAALIVFIILGFLITAVMIRNFAAKISSLERTKSESGAQLKGIINSMETILILTSTAQKITLWNRAAARLFGIQEEDALGKGLVEVLPFFQNFNTSFYKAVQGRKTIEIRRQKISLGDQDRIFDIRIGHGESSESIVVAMDDITLREAMERQIDQEQKTQVVKNMIKNLAGSFSEVIEQIGSTVRFIEISSDGRDLDFEHLTKNVHLIESHAEKANAAVQQLNRFAEHRKIRPASLDLNELVRHVLEICRDTFDQSIDISFQPYDLPAAAHADPALLEIALLNICENAEHAMTIMREKDDVSAGVMEVSIEKIFPDRTYRQIHPLAMASSYWTISIKDNGVGMEDSLMPKIFDPFFTTKANQKSVGLGLTITEEIVHHHDGFLEVYSRPAEGANFIVYLPDRL